MLSKQKVLMYKTQLQFENAFRTKEGTSMTGQIFRTTSRPEDKCFQVRVKDSLRCFRQGAVVGDRMTLRSLTVEDDKSKEEEVESDEISSHQREMVKRCNSVFKRKLQIFEVLRTSLTHLNQV